VKNLPGSHDDGEKFEGPMIAISARLAVSRLHYAWVIIAITFVVIVVTAGVRATSGVLIVPFENEFHWSRATISFAIGINLLVYGLVGPFAAAAMDRFGVRRTMALSLTVAAAGVALSPLMHNPWQLVLLWGLVVGLSTGFVGAYLAAYIAARWFHARQGMVVGLLTAANAAGQLIFLPTPRACSLPPASSPSSAAPLLVGSATDLTTDICCFGIMDCAACRYCTCPLPSTFRSTACRCSAYFTVSTGSPPQRRQCGSSVMRSAWSGSASWWRGSP
jgi:hypothetical protein